MVVQDQTPLIAQEWIEAVANDDEDAVVLEGLRPTRSRTGRGSPGRRHRAVRPRHGGPEKTMLGSFTQKPCAVYSSAAGAASTP